MSDSEEDVCRICRLEGEEGRPLLTPCRCQGSSGFLHEECLQAWLKYKGRNSCELCGHVYTFKPIMAPNAPDSLPPKDIALALFKFVRNVKAQIAIATTYWFILYPIFISFVYRLYVHWPTFFQYDLWDLVTVRSILDAHATGLIMVALCVALIIHLYLLREIVKSYLRTKMHSDTDAAHVSLLLEAFSVVWHKFKTLAPSEESTNSKVSSEDSKSVFQIPPHACTMSDFERQIRHILPDSALFARTIASDAIHFLIYFAPVNYILSEYIINVDPFAYQVLYALFYYFTIVTIATLLVKKFLWQSNFEAKLYSIATHRSTRDAEIEEVMLYNEGFRPNKSNLSSKNHTPRLAFEKVGDNIYRPTVELAHWMATGLSLDLGRSLSNRDVVVTYLQKLRMVSLRFTLLVLFAFVYESFALHSPIRGLVSYFDDSYPYMHVTSRLSPYEMELVSKKIMQNYSWLDEYTNSVEYRTPTTMFDRIGFWLIPIPSLSPPVRNAKPWIPENPTELPSRGDIIRALRYNRDYSMRFKALLGSSIRSVLSSAREDEVFVVNETVEVGYDGTVHPLTNLSENGVGHHPKLPHAGSVLSSLGLPLELQDAAQRERTRGLLAGLLIVLMQTLLLLRLLSPASLRSPRLLAGFVPKRFYWRSTSVGALEPELLLDSKSFGPVPLPLFARSAPPLELLRTGLARFSDAALRLRSQLSSQEAQKSPEDLLEEIEIERERLLLSPSSASLAPGRGLRGAVAARAELEAEAHAMSGFALFHNYVEMRYGVGGLAMRSDADVARLMDLKPPPAAAGAATSLGSLRQQPNVFEAHWRLQENSMFRRRATRDNRLGDIHSESDFSRIYGLYSPADVREHYALDRATGSLMVRNPAVFAKFAAPRAHSSSTDEVREGAVRSCCSRLSGIFRRGKSGPKSPSSFRAHYAAAVMDLQDFVQLDEPLPVGESAAAAGGAAVAGGPRLSINFNIGGRGGHIHGRAGLEALAAAAGAGAAAGGAEEPAKVLENSLFDQQMEERDEDEVTQFIETHLLDQETQECPDDVSRIRRLLRARVPKFSSRGPNNALLQLRGLGGAVQSMSQAIYGLDGAGRSVHGAFRGHAHNSLFHLVDQVSQLVNRLSGAGDRPVKHEDRNPSIQTPFYPFLRPSGRLFPDSRLLLSQPQRIPFSAQPISDITSYSIDSGAVLPSAPDMVVDAAILHGPGVKSVSKQALGLEEVEIGAVDRLYFCDFEAESVEPRFILSGAFFRAADSSDVVLETFDLSEEEEEEGEEEEEEEEEREQELAFSNFLKKHPDMDDHISSLRKHSAHFLETLSPESSEEGRVPSSTDQKSNSDTESVENEIPDDVSPHLLSKIERQMARIDRISKRIDEESAARAALDSQLLQLRTFASGYALRDIPAFASRQPSDPSIGIHPVKGLSTLLDRSEQLTASGRLLFEGLRMGISLQPVARAHLQRTQTCGHCSSDNALSAGQLKKPRKDGPRFPLPPPLMEFRGGPVHLCQGCVGCSFSRKSLRPVLDYNHMEAILTRRRGQAVRGTSRTAPAAGSGGKSRAGVVQGGSWTIGGGTAGQEGLRPFPTLQEALRWLYVGLLGSAQPLHCLGLVAHFLNADSLLEAANKELDGFDATARLGLLDDCSPFLSDSLMAAGTLMEQYFSLIAPPASPSTSASNVENDRKGQFLGRAEEQLLLKELVADSLGDDVDGYLRRLLLGTICGTLSSNPSLLVSSSRNSPLSDNLSSFQHVSPRRHPSSHQKLDLGGVPTRWPPGQMHAAVQHFLLGSRSSPEMAESQSQSSSTKKSNLSIEALSVAVLEEWNAQLRVQHAPLLMPRPEDGLMGVEQVRTLNAVRIPIKQSDALPQFWELFGVDSPSSSPFPYGRPVEAPGLDSNTAEPSDKSVCIERDDLHFLNPALAPLRLAFALHASEAHVLLLLFLRQLQRDALFNAAHAVPGSAPESHSLPAVDSVHIHRIISAAEVALDVPCGSMLAFHRLDPSCSFFRKASDLKLAAVQSALTAVSRQREAGDLTSPLVESQLEAGLDRFISSTCEASESSNTSRPDPSRKRSSWKSVHSLRQTHLGPRLSTLPPLARQMVAFQMDKLVPGLRSDRSQTKNSALSDVAVLQGWLALGEPQSNAAAGAAAAPGLQTLLQALPFDVNADADFRPFAPLKGSSDPHENSPSGSVRVGGLPLLPGLLGAFSQRFLTISGVSLHDMVSNALIGAPSSLPPSIRVVDPKEYFQKQNSTPTPSGSPDPKAGEESSSKSPAKHQTPQSKLSSPRSTEFYFADSPYGVLSPSPQPHDRNALRVYLEGRDVDLTFANAPRFRQPSFLSSFLGIPSTEAVDAGPDVSLQKTKSSSLFSSNKKARRKQTHSSASEYRDDLSGSESEEELAVIPLLSAEDPSGRPVHAGLRPFKEEAPIVNFAEFDQLVELQRTARGEGDTTPPPENNGAFVGETFLSEFQAEHSFAILRGFPPDEFPGSRRTHRPELSPEDAEDMLDMLQYLMKGGDPSDSVSPALRGDGAVPVVRSSRLIVRALLRRTAVRAAARARARTHARHVMRAREDQAQLQAVQQQAGAGGPINAPAAAADGPAGEGAGPEEIPPPPGPLVAAMDFFGFLGPWENFANAAAWSLIGGPLILFLFVGVPVVVVRTAWLSRRSGGELGLQMLEGENHPEPGSSVISFQDVVQVLSVPLSLSVLLVAITCLRDLLVALAGSLRARSHSLRLAAGRLLVRFGNSTRERLVRRLFNAQIANRMLATQRNTPFFPSEEQIRTLLSGSNIYQELRQRCRGLYGVVEAAAMTPLVGLKRVSSSVAVARALALVFLRTVLFPILHGVLLVDVVFVRLVSPLMLHPASLLCALAPAALQAGSAGARAQLDCLTNSGIPPSLHLLRAAFPSSEQFSENGDVFGGQVDWRRLLPAEAPQELYFGRAFGVWDALTPGSTLGEWLYAPVQALASRALAGALLQTSMLWLASQARQRFAHWVLGRRTMHIAADNMPMGILAESPIAKSLLLSVGMHLGALFVAMWGILLPLQAARSALAVKLFREDLAAGRVLAPGVQNGSFFLSAALTSNALVEPDFVSRNADRIHDFKARSNIPNPLSPENEEAYPFSVLIQDPNLAVIDGGLDLPSHFLPEEVLLAGSAFNESEHSFERVDPVKEGKDTRQRPKMRNIESPLWSLFRGGTSNHGTLTLLSASCVPAVEVLGSQHPSEATSHFCSPGRILELKVFAHVHSRDERTKPTHVGPFSRGTLSPFAVEHLLVPPSQHATAFDAVPLWDRAAAHIRIGDIFSSQSLNLYDDLAGGPPAEFGAAPVRTAVLQSLEDLRPGPKMAGSLPLESPVADLLREIVGQKALVLSNSLAALLSPLVPPLPLLNGVRRLFWGREKESSSEPSAPQSEPSSHPTIAEEQSILETADDSPVVFRPANLSPFFNTSVFEGSREFDVLAPVFWRELGLSFSAETAPYYTADNAGGTNSDGLEPLLEAVAAPVTTEELRVLRTGAQVGRPALATREEYSLLLRKLEALDSEKYPPELVDVLHDYFLLSAFGLRAGGRTLVDAETIPRGLPLALLTAEQTWDSLTAFSGMLHMPSLDEWAFNRTVLRAWIQRTQEGVNDMDTGEVEVELLLREVLSRAANGTVDFPLLDDPLWLDKHLSEVHLEDTDNQNTLRGTVESRAQMLVRLARLRRLPVRSELLLRRMPVVRLNALFVGPHRRRPTGLWLRLRAAGVVALSSTNLRNGRGKQSSDPFQLQQLGEHYPPLRPAFASPELPANPNSVWVDQAHRHMYGNPSGFVIIGSHIFRNMTVSYSAAETTTRPSTVPADSVGNLLDLHSSGEEDVYPVQMVKERRLLPIYNHNNIQFFRDFRHLLDHFDEFSDNIRLIDAARSFHINEENVDESKDYPSLKDIAYLVADTENKYRRFISQAQLAISSNASANDTNVTISLDVGGEPTLEEEELLSESDTIESLSRRLKQRSQSLKAAVFHYRDWISRHPTMEITLPDMVPQTRRILDIYSSAPVTASTAPRTPSSFHRAPTSILAEALRVVRALLHRLQDSSILTAPANGELLTNGFMRLLQPLRALWMLVRFPKFTPAVEVATGPVGVATDLLTFWQLSPLQYDHLASAETDSFEQPWSHAELHRLVQRGRSGGAFVAPSGFQLSETPSVTGFLSNWDDPQQLQTLKVGTIVEKGPNAGMVTCHLTGKGLAEFRAESASSSRAATSRGEGHVSRRSMRFSSNTTNSSIDGENLHQEPEPGHPKKVRTHFHSYQIDQLGRVMDCGPVVAPAEYLAGLLPPESAVLRGAVFVSAGFVSPALTASLLPPGSIVDSRWLNDYSVLKSYMNVTAAQLQTQQAAGGALSLLEPLQSLLAAAAGVLQESLRPRLSPSTADSLRTLLAVASFYLLAVSTGAAARMLSGLVSLPLFAVAAFVDFLERRLPEDAEGEKSTWFSILHYVKDGFDAVLPPRRDFLVIVGIRPQLMDGDTPIQSENVDTASQNDPSAVDETLVADILSKFRDESHDVLAALLNDKHATDALLTGDNSAQSVSQIRETLERLNSNSPSTDLLRRSDALLADSLSVLLPPPASKARSMNKFLPESINTLVQRRAHSLGAPAMPAEVPMPGHWTTVAPAASAAGLSAGDVARRRGGAPPTLHTVSLGGEFVTERAAHPLLRVVHQRLDQGMRDREAENAVETVLQGCFRLWGRWGTQAPMNATNALPMQPFMRCVEQHSLLNELETLERDVRFWRTPLPILTLCCVWMVLWGRLSLQEVQNVLSLRWSSPHTPSQSAFCPFQPLRLLPKEHIFNVHFSELALRRLQPSETQSRFNDLLDSVLSNRAPILPIDTSLGKSSSITSNEVSSSSTNVVAVKEDPLLEQRLRHAVIAQERLRVSLPANSTPPAIGDINGFLPLKKPLRVSAHSPVRELQMLLMEGQWLWTRLETEDRDLTDHLLRGNSGTPGLGWRRGRVLDLPVIVDTSIAQERSQLVLQHRTPAFVAAIILKTLFKVAIDGKFESGRTMVSQLPRGYQDLLTGSAQPLEPEKLRQNLDSILRLLSKSVALYGHSTMTSSSPPLPPFFPKRLHYASGASTPVTGHPFATGPSTNNRSAFQGSSRPQEHQWTTPPNRGKGKTVQPPSVQAQELQAFLQLYAQSSLRLNSGLSARAQFFALNSAYAAAVAHVRGRWRRATEFAEIALLAAAASGQNPVAVVLVAAEEAAAAAKELYHMRSRNNISQKFDLQSYVIFNDNKSDNKYNLCTDRTNVNSSERAWSDVELKLAERLQSSTSFFVAAAALLRNAYADNPNAAKHVAHSRTVWGHAGTDFSRQIYDGSPVPQPNGNQGTPEPSFNPLLPGVLCGCDTAVGFVAGGDLRAAAAEALSLSEPNDSGDGDARFHKEYVSKLFELAGFLHPSDATAAPTAGTAASSANAKSLYLDGYYHKSGGMAGLAASPLPPLPTELWAPPVARSAASLRRSFARAFFDGLRLGVHGELSRMGRVRPTLLPQVAESEAGVAVRPLLVPSSLKALELGCVAACAAPFAQGAHALGVDFQAVMGNDELLSGATPAISDAAEAFLEAQAPGKRWLPRQADEALARGLKNTSPLQQRRYAFSHLPGARGAPSLVAVLPSTATAASGSKTGCCAGVEPVSRGQSLRGHDIRSLRRAGAICTQALRQQYGPAGLYDARGLHTAPLLSLSSIRGRDNGDDERRGSAGVNENEMESVEVLNSCGFSRAPFRIGAERTLGPVDLSICVRELTPEEDQDPAAEAFLFQLRAAQRTRLYGPAPKFSELEFMSRVAAPLQDLSARAGVDSRAPYLSQAAYSEAEAEAGIAASRDAFGLSRGLGQGRDEVRLWHPVLAQSPMLERLIEGDFKETFQDGNVPAPVSVIPAYLEKSPLFRSLNTVATTAAALVRALARGETDCTVVRAFVESPSTQVHSPYSDTANSALSPLILKLEQQIFNAQLAPQVDRLVERVSSERLVPSVSTFVNAEVPSSSDVPEVSETKKPEESSSLHSVDEETFPALPDDLGEGWGSSGSGTWPANASKDDLTGYTVDTDEDDAIFTHSVSSGAGEEPATASPTLNSEKQRQLEQATEEALRQDPLPQVPLPGLLLVRASLSLAAQAIGSGEFAVKRAQELTAPVILRPLDRNVHVSLGAVCSSNNNGNIKENEGATLSNNSASSGLPEVLLHFDKLALEIYSLHHAFTSMRQVSFESQRLAQLASADIRYDAAFRSHFASVNLRLRRWGLLSTPAGAGTEESLAGSALDEELSSLLTGEKVQILSGLPFHLKEERLAGLGRLASRSVAEAVSFLFDVVPTGAGELQALTKTFRESQDLPWFRTHDFSSSVNATPNEGFFVVQDDVLFPTRVVAGVGGSAARWACAHSVVPVISSRRINIRSSAVEIQCSANKELDYFSSSFAGIDEAVHQESGARNARKTESQVPLQLPIPTCVEPPLCSKCGLPGAVAGRISSFFSVSSTILCDCCVSAADLANPSTVKLDWSRDIHAENLDLHKPYNRPSGSDSVTTASEQKRRVLLRPVRASEQPSALRNGVAGTVPRRNALSLALAPTALAVGLLLLGVVLLALLAAAGAIAAPLQPLLRFLGPLPSLLALGVLISSLLLPMLFLLVSGLTLLSAWTLQKAAAVSANAEHIEAALQLRTGASQANCVEAELPSRLPLSPTGLTLTDLVLTHKGFWGHVERPLLRVGAFCLRWMLSGLMGTSLGDVASASTQLQALVPSYLRTLLNFFVLVPLARGLLLSALLTELNLLMSGPSPITVLYNCLCAGWLVNAVCALVATLRHSYHNSSEEVVLPFDFFPVALGSGFPAPMLLRALALHSSYANRLYRPWSSLLKATVVLAVRLTLRLLAEYAVLGSATSVVLGLVGIVALVVVLARSEIVRRSFHTPGSPLYGLGCSVKDFMHQLYVSRYQVGVSIENYPEELRARMRNVRAGISEDQL